MSPFRKKMSFSRYFRIFFSFSTYLSKYFFLSFLPIFLILSLSIYLSIFPCLYLSSYISVSISPFISNSYSIYAITFTLNFINSKTVQILEAVTEYENSLEQIDGLGVGNDLVNNNILGKFSIQQF